MLLLRQTSYCGISTVNLSSSHRPNYTVLSLEMQINAKAYVNLQNVTIFIASNIILVSRQFSTPHRSCAQQCYTARRKQLNISWHTSVSFTVSSWSLYSYICDLFNDVLRTLECVT